MEKLLNEYATEIQEVLLEDGHGLLDVEIIVSEPEDECDVDCDNCIYGEFEDEELIGEEDYLDGYEYGKFVAGVLDGLLDEEIEWSAALEIMEAIL